VVISSNQLPRQAISIPMSGNRVPRVSATFSAGVSSSVSRVASSRLLTFE
jgi:hypothetical protein